MSEERKYPILMNLLNHRSSINPEVYRQWINDSDDKTIDEFKKEISLLVERAIQPKKKYHIERSLLFTLWEALDYAYEGK